MLLVNHLTGFGARGVNGNDQFTKLLLHMDGADASTSFPNSAVGGTSAFSAQGSAQVDTAQSKFGGASLLLDGTGDYLQGDGSSDFAFGTGDFTIDFWLRGNATGATQVLYDSRPNGTNGAYMSINVNSSDTVNVFVSSSAQIASTTVFSSGVWYHIAVVRTGGTTKLFIDGTQEGGDWSDGTTYLNPASRPRIGERGSATGAALNGWLDEFRVSNIARWTANFTPPAAPYF